MVKLRTSELLTRGWRTEWARETFKSGETTLGAHSIFGVVLALSVASPLPPTSDSKVAQAPVQLIPAMCEGAESRLKRACSIHEGCAETGLRQIGWVHELICVVRKHASSAIPCFLAICQGQTKQADLGSVNDKQASTPLSGTKDGCFAVRCWKTGWDVLETHLEIHPAHKKSARMHVSRTFL